MKLDKLKEKSEEDEKNAIGKKLYLLQDAVMNQFVVQKILQSENPSDILDTNFIFVNTAPGSLNSSNIIILK